MMRLPNSALPLELSSFVGREHDVATVRSLSRVSLLVTLTGVGGIGKTRLALQCARLIESEFANGAFLVDLSPVSIPGVVPKTVASALGVVEQPGREMLQ